MNNARAIKRLNRLNIAIKKNWAKLSDEEIALYQEKPEAFYDILKKRYGIFKSDAERRIKQFKVGYSIFNW
jgi:hypothetical protein